MMMGPAARPMQMIPSVATGEELSQAPLAASGAAESLGLRREGCEGGRVVCKSVLLRAKWSLHDLHRRRRHHVFRS